MPKKSANDGLYRKRDKSGEAFGFWYLPIWVDGKKHVRSTETEDLSEAKERIPYLVSRLMTDLGKDAGRINRIEWTLKNLFDEVLASKSNASKSTLANYKTLFRQMLSFFGETKKINSFVDSDIRAWINHRTSGGKAKAISINQQLTLFAAALNYAKGRAAFTGDVKKLIPQENRFRRSIRKRFLSPEEFQKVCKAAEESRSCQYVADYIRAYIFLGLSKNELWTIRVRDVQLSEGWFTVHGTKTESRTATLPIPEPMIPIFRKYMEGKSLDAVVFPEKKHFYHTFIRMVKKAGIAHCTVHDLRRTTGSVLISNGANLKTVQAVLRHSTVAITSLHYAHLSPNVAPHALNMLAGIMEKTAD